ncbi:N-acetylmuramoyl-L-alanine amidase [Sphaerisporangium sp. TRM90804]|uniref:golvesin C-terminal-like domain-containing protein n=1 Tax=Sphaerisporangium sp. TRM90804 TaxID=3031113 RepID=UPI002449B9FE|nr:N-acetylmuramoyl-L-alanine amidase [Sphaerisporangium sp. TRM90804]MDH2428329.1 N-acetylmuramoyl-L-alanine amidase [Sphaerisporangium sp. TRM90804]
MTSTLSRLSAVVACALAALFTLAAAPAGAARDVPLNEAFARAAAAHDVPRDLLVALAYAETHLDGHGGAPSASGGYGVMHLVSNPTTRTLEKAAELTGLPAATLRADDVANVLGGAAVLRSYADQLGLDETARKDPGRWYAVVAKYGNASTPELARLYADAVYELLGLGVKAAGVKVSAQEVTADRGPYAMTRDLNAQRALSPDYGPAAWVPANSGNYTVSSRESTYAIDRVIIHVTQGSYAGTISWFQNAASNVSAHYVVRSSDGAVTQMVRDKDVAYHAGNWGYNTRSIGIEHEGFVSEPSWFTDAMYRSSAALTRAMCDKYGIPKDRTHIIGHNQVPGATHTDPGQYWDWNRYMQYVTGGSIPPAWTATVDNSTAGAFSASGNWGTSAYSAQRHGADYRYAGPVASSDPAWYSTNVPSAGSYRVEVWYPADPGYNSSAPYIVATASGNQTVYVDQRAGGGAWRTIGTFTLNAGTYNVVGVSRWTSGTGYVIADAVRISR